MIDAAIEDARQLAAAGVTLSGQVDGRGVAFVVIPGSHALTPIDEALSVLHAQRVQRHLLALALEAAKAADGEGGSAAKCPADANAAAEALG